MIALPPLFTGAVNDTVACAFPTMADTFVGASGTVTGGVLSTVTVSVGLNCLSFPVKSYAAPGVKVQTPTSLFCGNGIEICIVPFMEVPE